jgi:hypothetical protein
MPLVDTANNMYIKRINQTAWKRIIGWILFNYFAFCYRILDVFQSYLPLPHSGQQMFGQGNRLIGTTRPDIFNA